MRIPPGLLVGRGQGRFSEIAVRSAMGGFPRQWIRQLLFEVEPLDPASYFGAALFLVAVTAAACPLPALRALRSE